MDYRGVSSSLTGLLVGCGWRPVAAWADAASTLGKERTSELQTFRIPVDVAYVGTTTEGT